MSPYEANARERKAAKIADHILICFREAGGSVEPQPIANLVLELSAAGPGVRAAFATGADTKAPSAQTWLRVIELIGRQGVLAHVAAEATRDPFEGLTEADDPFARTTEHAATRRNVERDTFAGLTEVEVKAGRRGNRRSKSTMPACAAVYGLGRIA